MVEVDSYEVMSKYYDASYAANEQLVDLPFYLERSKAAGGPVLELGCGTGRVLIPAARAGVEVTGMEPAKSMRAVLSANLARETDAVRSRVRVVEGDMRSTHAGGPFALVTIPFRPLQHLYAFEDQLSALRNAARHLRSDGRLIFDVFYPKYELLLGGVGTVFQELELPVPGAPQQVMKRYFRKDAVNMLTQVFRGAMVYRIFEKEALVREEEEPFQMSWYTYPQIQALTRLAGLEIVETFGGFKGEPLNETARDMVFVLRKAD